MGLGEGRGLSVPNTYRLHRYRIYSTGRNRQAIWIPPCTARGALPTLRSLLHKAPLLQCPSPTGGVATSPPFRVHQGDTALVLLLSARNGVLGAAQPACGPRVCAGGSKGEKTEREKEIHRFIPTYLRRQSPKTCRLPTAIFWFAHPKFLTIEHEACALFGFLFLALEHRFD